MKKQMTPARQAAHATEFIYSEVIPSAAREAGIDLCDPKAKVVIVVSVPGYSPRESFKTQRAYSREKCAKPLSVEEIGRTRKEGVEAQWEADERQLRNWVWEMLKGGAEPSEVHAVLQEEQRWPWMAIATERAMLERELHARYSLAVCELDMNWTPIPIPGGMAIEGIFYTRADRKRR